MKVPFLRPPGMSFPEGEQKQFGSRHFSTSQGLAWFSTLTASQELSSDPSSQSFFPSHNFDFDKHVPSAQANIGTVLFLPPHLDSSKSGKAVWLRLSTSQLSTSAAHWHVCSSMSKSRPVGHLKWESPPLEQETTERQSPPPDTLASRKNSPGTCRASGSRQIWL